MVRRLSATILAFSLLFAAAAVVPLGSATTTSPAPQDVLVAVLDTGAHPYHQEFGDYSAANHGNFVAWWDFTATFKPNAAQRDPFQNAVNGVVPTWDPVVANPYDDNGHGTGTASLVAGLNVKSCSPSTPKLSYAPGVKLAILKVLDKGGSGNLDTIALAVRYATEVLHADVLSMSLGATIPLPGSLGSMDEALKAARAAGTLPVVAAGNGVNNFGLIPAPSELFYNGLSTASLIVGGGNSAGTNLATLTSSLDPEVAAWSDSVCMAKTGTTNQYFTGSGTSMATPLVAGMAATCIKEAKANGKASDPDTTERVLKHAAKDTVLPYAREGWGFLGTPEFNAAKAACAAGTVPAYRPYQGTPVNPNEAYEAAVADTLRATWSGEAISAIFQVSLGVSPQSGAGVLSTSSPAGLFEVELYKVTLAAGQSFTLTADYGPYVTANLKSVQDFDVHFYAPGASSDGMLLDEERLDVAGAGAGAKETLSYTAAAAGTYEVAIVAWSIVGSQPITLSADAPLAFESEFLATGNNVIVS